MLKSQVYVGKIADNNCTTEASKEASAELGQAFFNANISASHDMNALTDSILVLTDYL